MPDRASPVSIGVLGTLRLGATPEDEQREISRLTEEILSADRARSGWLERQQRLTRLRYGIRRPKTFPWKGASNLSIPLIDAVIRKFKPMLMRLLVEPDPVVEFVGEDEEAIGAERIAETVYNWLFKTEMNALEPMAFVIDQLCHRGFSFAQVGWDYRTEYENRVVPVASLFHTPESRQDPQAIVAKLVDEYRLYPDDPRVSEALNKAAQRIQAGDEFVLLAFKRVVADRPAIWDRDPVQVIAPARTTDPEDAEWLVVQHVLSLRTLKQKEADRFFIAGSVARIAEGFKRGRAGGVEDKMTTSLHQEEMQQDERERIFGNEDEDNVLIWEIYHWTDHNGDGLLERTISFVHPRSRTKLRAVPYFYPFNCWPIVKFDFEKTGRRWHSPRGISAMLADLQKEVNNQHNARLDGMTLRNAPCYQTPLLGNFKAHTFRVRPGEVIHTPAGARLEPLVQDRGAYPEMVNEENMLRSISESYVGTYDAAISSPTAQTQARTATEIQAVAQYTAATSTFDAILFQLSMRKLHTLVWQLFQDLGPDEVFVKVLGDAPDDNEPQLTRVKKADINRRFKLVPTGTIANTNRAIEMGHAREALQLFVNDQSGLINKWELYRWYLTLLSYRWSRRMLNTQDQAREQVVLQQAAAAYEQDPSLRAAMGVPGAETPQPEEQAVPEMGASAVT